MSNSILSPDSVHTMSGNPRYSNDSQFVIDRSDGDVSSHSKSGSSRSRRISSDEYCDPLGVETGLEANPNDNLQPSGPFVAINKHPLSAISPQCDKSDENLSTPEELVHADDEFAVLGESGPESLDNKPQKHPANKPRQSSLSFRSDNSSKNCYL